MIRKMLKKIQSKAKTLKYDKLILGMMGKREQGYTTPFYVLVLLVLCWLCFNSFSNLTLPQMFNYYVHLASPNYYSIDLKPNCETVADMQRTPVIIIWWYIHNHVYCIMSRSSLKNGEIEHTGHYPCILALCISI